MLNSNHASKGFPAQLPGSLESSRILFCDFCGRTPLLLNEGALLIPGGCERGSTTETRKAQKGEGRSPAVASRTTQHTYRFLFGSAGSVRGVNQLSELRQKVLQEALNSRIAGLSAFSHLVVCSNAGANLDDSAIGASIQ